MFKILLKKIIKIRYDILFFSSVRLCNNPVQTQLPSHRALQKFELTHSIQLQNKECKKFKKNCIKLD